MGRKPLPDNQKKHRIELWVTDAEEAELRKFIGAWLDRTAMPPTVAKNATINAPKTVRLPVVELHDESDDAIRKVFDAGDLYVPSMRECGICGKDYDGNLHESCPHEHVPNGKGRK